MKGPQTIEGRVKALDALDRGRRGRHLSSATIARIASAQAGAKSAAWRGDTVGYGGAHKRHRAALPPYCEECGATNETTRIDVALRHDAPVERLLGDVRRRQMFSLSTDDYVRLCRSCHIRYDRALART